MLYISECDDLALPILSRLSPSFPYILPLPLWYAEFAEACCVLDSRDLLQSGLHVYKILSEPDYLERFWQDLVHVLSKVHGLIVAAGVVIDQRAQQDGAQIPLQVLLLSRLQMKMMRLGVFIILAHRASKYHIASKWGHQWEGQHLRAQHTAHQALF